MKPREKPPVPKNNNKQAFSYARYTGMAFQMMGTILVFTFLGYKTDKWLDLKFPIFLLVGIFAGLFGSMYSIFKSLK